MRSASLGSHFASEVRISTASTSREQSSGPHGKNTRDGHFFGYQLTPLENQEGTSRGFKAICWKMMCRIWKSMCFRVSYWNIGFHVLIIILARRIVVDRQIFDQKNQAKSASTSDILANASLGDTRNDRMGCSFQGSWESWESFARWLGKFDLRRSIRTNCENNQTIRSISLSKFGKVRHGSSFKRVWIWCPPLFFCGKTLEFL